MADEPSKNSTPTSKEKRKAQEERLAWVNARSKAIQEGHITPPESGSFGKGIPDTPKPKKKSKS